MNEDEKQWVLDNVDVINADTRDIEELCCALEHSTIFAVDYIETFSTKLIDLDYKSKDLQQRIDKAISFIYLLKNNVRDYKTKYKEDFLNMLDDIGNILGDKE